jgi:calcium/calmodulin-dependent protein kinase I
MENNSEETDLKIVDFGLSKIIGPNETSLDPFGTLVSNHTISYFN